MHVIFSLINTMYVPYAIVYFVDRVHLMCRLNSACNELTFGDYMSDENLVIIVIGTLLHIPIMSCILLIADVKKSGGKLSDAFRCLLVSRMSFYLYTWFLFLQCSMHTNYGLLPTCNQNLLRLNSQNTTSSLKYVP